MLIALLAPFVLLAISIVIASLLRHTPISFSGFGKSREFEQFSAIGFLGFNIVSFGFGEEVGWRATIDVAFTSTLASPMVVTVLGAFITVWGILVVMIAGPRFLSRHSTKVLPTDLCLQNTR